MNQKVTLSLSRRHFATLAGAGVAAIFVPAWNETIEAAETLTCVPSTPTVTEGPYWVDEKLFRSDVRTDPSTGVARAGIPLTLTINVQIADVQLNQWTHLRVARFNNSIFVFKDGILRSNTGYSQPIDDNDAAVLIGRGSDGSAGFIGFIDNVRIKKGQADLNPYSIDMGPLGTEQWVPTTKLDRALLSPSQGYQWPVGITRLHTGLRALRDFTQAPGRGRIVGTVTVNGDPTNTPVSRRVVLLRDIDALVLGTTWSDPVTGAYEFSNLDTSFKYTVLSFDHEHVYRAVAADNLETVL